jgi:hypothetical protein
MVGAEDAGAVVGTGAEDPRLRRNKQEKPISHEALAAARVRPIEPLRWALAGRMRALAPTTAMRGRGLIQEQFRSGG